ncbi:hypothetical protein SS50377_22952 [Spironucleus salmonicida]|uniref:Uncharacterized protein n=1 Tax=Spironucleus salmonicida TaxID=348837 RepID=V6LRH0_9EUKA|nr:hypothetical protein SS50377_22952 [Spironucleus salmonicida]|eukprot:EST46863.1 Hypothetical protein SS50377_13101 [Spironucleus salmonicida]
MLTNNELYLATRPKSRLQATHRPESPTHAFKLTQITQQTALNNSLNIQTTTQPEETTHSAISLYVSAAAEALNSIEALDPTAALTIKKVLDFLTSDERLSVKEIDAARRQAENYRKELLKTQEKLVYLQSDNAKNIEIVQIGVQKLQIQQEAIKKLERDQMMTDQEMTQLNVTNARIMDSLQTAQNEVLDLRQKRDSAARHSTLTVSQGVQLRTRYEDLLRQVAELKNSLIYEQQKNSGADRNESGFRQQIQLLESTISLQEEKRKALFLETLNSNSQSENFISQLLFMLQSLGFDCKPDAFKEDGVILLKRFIAKIQGSRQAIIRQMNVSGQFRDENSVESSVCGGEQEGEQQEGSEERNEEGSENGAKRKKLGKSKLVKGKRERALKEKPVKISSKNQAVQTRKLIGKKEATYKELEIDISSAPSLEVLAAELSNLGDSERETLKNNQIFIENDNLKAEIRKYFVPYKKYYKLKQQKESSNDQVSVEQIKLLKRQYTLNNLNIVSQLENCGLTKNQINEIAAIMKMSKQDIQEAGFSSYAEFQSVKLAELATAKTEILPLSTEPIYSENQTHRHTLTNPVICIPQIALKTAHEADSDSDSAQKLPQNDKKIATNYVFKVTEEVQVDSFKDFIKCICVHCKQNVKHENIAEVLSADENGSRTEAKMVDFRAPEAEARQLLVDKKQKITILQAYLGKIGAEKRKLQGVMQGFMKAAFLTKRDLEEQSSLEVKIQDLQAYEDAIQTELRSFEKKVGRHLGVFGKDQKSAEFLAVGVNQFNNSESSVISDIHNKVFSKQTIMKVQRPLRNLSEQLVLEVQETTLQDNSSQQQIMGDLLQVNKLQIDQQNSLENIDVQSQIMQANSVITTCDTIQQRFDNLRKPRQIKQEVNLVNEDYVPYINEDHQPLDPIQIQTDIRKLLMSKRPLNYPAQSVIAHGNSLQAFQQELHNSVNFYQIKQDGSYINPFKKLVEDKLMQGNIIDNKKRISMLQNKISLKKLIQFQLKKQEAKIKLLQNPELSMRSTADNQHQQSDYMQQLSQSTRKQTFELIRSLSPKKSKIVFEIQTKFLFNGTPNVFSSLCTNLSDISSIHIRSFQKNTQQAEEFVNNFFKSNQILPYHVLIADKNKSNKILPKIKSKIYYILEHEYYKKFMSFAQKDRKFIICEDTSEIKIISWILNLINQFLNEISYEITRNLNELTRLDSLPIDLILENYLERNYGLQDIIQKYKYNFVINLVFYYQQNSAIELAFLIFTKQLSPQNCVFIVFCINQLDKENYKKQEAFDFSNFIFPQLLSIQVQQLEDNISSSIKDNSINKYKLILILLTFFQSQKHQLFNFIIETVDDEIHIQDAEIILHKALPYVPRGQIYDHLIEKQSITKIYILSLICQVKPVTVNIIHSCADKMASLEKYLSTFIDQVNGEKVTKLEALRSSFYMYLESKNEIGCYIFCEQYWIEVVLQGFGIK